MLVLLQVKPEDNNVEQTGAGGGRQKLIREVFLPRLLATKVSTFNQLQGIYCYAVCVVSMCREFCSHLSMTCSRQCLMCPEGNHCRRQSNICLISWIGKPHKMVSLILKCYILGKQTGTDNFL